MDGEKSKMWSVCLRFEVKTWDPQERFSVSHAGQKVRRQKKTMDFLESILALNDRDCKSHDNPLP